ncbi:MAG TPA: hypothetical protein VMT29_18385 [Steroidobacteraceae bacterium]|nr:hypothetical protein [Steroidobacteraceae bacterium]
MSTELLRKLRCRLDRAALAALRPLFGFDPWHAAAPYSCRPYKATVVALVNELRPALAVEVGCGLGDIISRISARERYGIDVDGGVIRAARVLHPRGTRWVQGDAGVVGTVVPGDRTIDCLIMVNWIHNFAADQLGQWLQPLLPRTRHLLLDAIDADGPASYRHKHDFGFLGARARRRSTTHACGEPRSFILFEVGS